METIITTKDQTVLCIDTSYSAGQIVLSHQAKIYEYCGFDQRQQASILVPIIDDLLQQAGAQKTDIQKIGLSLGPGSYTGIRIGIAAAQGLSKGLGVPVKGMSSFSIIAKYLVEEKTPNQPFAIAIETMRKDSYLQLFDAQGMVASEMIAIEDEDLGQYLTENNVEVLVGNKNKKLKNSHIISEVIFEDVMNLPSAAFIALTQASQGKGNVSELAPIYLKAPDVSKSKKKFVTLE